MASSTTRIHGLDAALKELRKIDPKLAAEARKRLRNDAKPMVMEARGMIQTVPLSRWHEGTAKMQDRKGQKTLRSSSGFPVFALGPAKRRISLSMHNQRIDGFKGRRHLIAMVEKDAAGVILDAAGRKNRGNKFARNLNRRNGRASRFMWRAASKHEKNVAKTIRASVREIERDVNRRLRTASI